jgi:predicted metalloprotease
MRWRRAERSRNVEDRRGRAPAVAAGAGGLGIIGLLLALLLGGGGGGLGDLLNQLNTPSPGPAGPPATLSSADQEAGDRIAAVLGTTEQFWGEVYAEGGSDYPEPRLVLFTAATESACGGARREVGPHYCPLDSTIYMDLAFFDELQRRFGASGGDFAEAYVVAHEVGHHVQNVSGIMDEVRQRQQANQNEANVWSVRLELQADCFAGAWASAVFEQGLLERGDIEEALSAAEAVGDDRIQETITGRVNPESFTHGTSEQRVRWFEVGYNGGNPGACDTFDEQVS